MGDVGAGIADVAVHLAHDANVLVAVEQRVLVIFGAISAAVCSFVCLETRVGQHDDEALGVFIGRGYGVRLLSDEPRQRGRRQRLRLRSCGGGHLVSHATVRSSVLVERCDASMRRRCASRRVRWPSSTESSVAKEKALAR